MIECRSVLFPLPVLPAIKTCCWTPSPRSTLSVRLAPWLPTTISIPLAVDPFAASSSERIDSSGISTRAAANAASPIFCTSSLRMEAGGDGAGWKDRSSSPSDMSVQPPLESTFSSSSFSPLGIGMSLGQGFDSSQTRTVKIPQRKPLSIRARRCRKPLRERPSGKPMAATAR